MSQQQSTPMRSTSEGVLRVLFGVFLAVIAIALVLYNAQWFAAVTVLMTLFAAREWHRMVRAPQRAAEMERQPIHVQTIITGATTSMALTALVLRSVYLKTVKVQLALLVQLRTLY